MVQKLAILVDDADPAAGPRDVIPAEAAHIAVEERDAPRRGQQFGIAQLEEGRLSRPRWAGQEMERPRGKAQRDVGQKLSPP